MITKIIMKIISVQLKILFVLASLFLILLIIGTIKDGRR